MGSGKYYYIYTNNYIKSGILKLIKDMAEEFKLGLTEVNTRGIGRMIKQI